MGMAKIHEKKKERRKERKEREKRKKIQEKLNTGNYRLCYLCDKSLMNIKNDMNKRICDECNKIDVIKILTNNYPSIICEYKKKCERNICVNCDDIFITLLYKNNYLCKKCINDNKVINCKICRDSVLLEINSRDNYCVECENKLCRCIDCEKEFIKIDNNVNRCQTCQLCYENKMILQKCEYCEDEFSRKIKEHWKKSCTDCFTATRNNRICISKICNNCDEEFDIKPNETWKKICGECYKKTVNKFNCVNCSKEFSKISSETWKTMCNECYKYFKNI
jgi:hypothetical protein